MAIDITNKEEKQIALTGAEIEETLLQAHLSKDAIEKIKGLEVSASEIDNSVMIHTHMDNFIQEGETDMALAFNRAVAYVSDNRATIKNSTVILSPGLKSIETPLRLLKGVSIIGAGSGRALDGGTEFVCNFSQETIDSPPIDIYTDHHNVLLDYTPMMYNAELMTGSTFEGFRLNGNNKNVYGLYISEMYYSTSSQILIKNCNKSPFTLVYCQFNELFLTSLVNNADKGRLICCSTTTINGMDIEGFTGTSPTVLDIIHDLSYKAGITINNLHYEDGTAEGTPPGDFIRIGQRGVVIKESYLFERGNNIRSISMINAGTTYTFDGVTIASVSPAYSKVDVLSSGNTFKIKLDSNTESNLEFNTNLKVDTSLLTTTSPTVKVGMAKYLRGLVIKTRDNLSNVLSFPSDERIDFGDGMRKIYFNNNQLVIENSIVGGPTFLKSNGRMQISAVEDVRTQSNNLRLLKKDGTAGDWKEGLLILSDYRLWVDTNGVLRIKNGIPTSDFDGVAVGLQS